MPSVRPTTGDDATVFHRVMMEAGRFDIDPRSGWHRVSPADVELSLTWYGGFLAEDDGEVVGVVSYRPYGPRSTTLTLNKLGVLPHARGRGVASLLVRAVETHARQNGYRQVLLAVSALNTRVVPIYQHLGYTIDPDAVYPFASPLSDPPVVLVKPIFQPGHDAHTPDSPDPEVHA
jgi:ribosomal protein S18 acetylase RimI-like enzyme